MLLSILGAWELGLANHVGRAASSNAHGPGVQGTVRASPPACCFSPAQVNKAHVLGISVLSAPSAHPSAPPNPAPAAQTGTGAYGAPGSDQDLSSQLYIFSCLMVRAECTRLCCRMLPLGSWQRLISKCQLLSGGAGSNESQWFVLIPGTTLPSPRFRNRRNAGSGASEKETFSSFFSRNEGKKTSRQRVWQHMAISPNPAGCSPVALPLKVCLRTRCDEAAFCSRPCLYLPASICRLQ